MKKKQIDRIKNLDLETFDAKLRSIAENGVFDEAMEENLDRLIQKTEPTRLTTSELSHFYHSVNKASVEKAIMEARNITLVSSLPLGRFLQLVRDRSGLSHEQVARALNKEATFIAKLENGQTNPLSMIASDIADIMQMFRLTITEMIEALKAFLATGKTKQYRISGMARSSIKADAADKGEKLAHAMDALQAAIAKKKSHGRPDKVKIDPAYIEALKKELKKRSAEDLLV